MIENPFAFIERRFNRIENLLLELQANLPVTPDNISSEGFIGVEEAAQFLDIAHQTIYQNIRKIPHTKKFGRLYFKRSELINYLEQGAITSKRAKL